MTKYVTSNILDSQVTNNSRCFRVHPSKSEPYRHSFFVRTIIEVGIHLEDDIVDAPSTEAFQEGGIRGNAWRTFNLTTYRILSLFSLQVELAPHLLSP